jgi:hypothetical protein
MEVVALAMEEPVLATEGAIRGWMRMRSRLHSQVNEGIA